MIILYRTKAECLRNDETEITLTLHHKDTPIEPYPYKMAEYYAMDKVLNFHDVMSVSNIKTDRVIAIPLDNEQGIQQIEQLKIQIKKQLDEINTITNGNLQLDWNSSNAHLSGKDFIIIEPKVKFKPEVNINISDFIQAFNDESLFQAISEGKQPDFQDFFEMYLSKKRLNNINKTGKKISVKIKRKTR